MNEKDQLEKAKDELNTAGLRFAEQHEAGWYYTLSNGDKVWVTDLPLSPREVESIIW